ncbi:MAG TPA: molybdenum cofactor guanylyltransferase, partial [Halococcus sp.]|nr:molybdenum cofactor guanylyltransferase [Halococcus sp.]
RLQPIQAVYRTGAMADACAAALSRSDRRLVSVLADLDYVAVEEDKTREYADLETFTNVNTREEFEEVTERLL